MTPELSCFIDNSLANQFDSKPFDLAHGRELLVAGIKRTYDRLDHPDKKDKTRWARVANGVVEFTVTIEGVIVPVAGNETNFIPQDRFKAFLATLIGLVKQGEYDAAMIEADNSRKAAERAKVEARIAARAAALAAAEEAQATGAPQLRIAAG